MRVVVAIDSFKGSLTSIEAGNAVEEGIKKACEADIIVSPIADGGEGTVDALVNGMGGVFKRTMVTGPLGEPVEAKWGIIEDTGDKTAIIEMAEAAGIALISNEQLNPYKTTTYGLGELIKEAIGEGCRRFIIGIGGSATNDGGAGMLQALGYDMLDRNGQAIDRGAIGLRDLVTINKDNVLKELAECTIRVACDVKNPLCGEMGCSAVFGPQKGATPDMVAQMDGWLEHYAQISGGDKEFPGTGAAGGLGFAFKNFLGASLEPGINIVLEETRLETKIETADLVVTGEGRIDAQTVMGKVPVGVAAIAKKYDKKVIAFCGCATEDARIVNNYGIDAYFTVLRSVTTLEEALNSKNARNNIALTVEQVFRVINK